LSHDQAESEKGHRNASYKAVNKAVLVQPHNCDQPDAQQTRQVVGSQ
jgi:hypothetical protein